MTGALEDGYEVTHRGLLAWCSQPPPGKVPRFRLLFYAIEATFSFYFWAMKRKDIDYGIGACCPWPLGVFTYNGLCSHNALRDMIRGQFNLTTEQLEALSALAKERPKEQDKLWRAKYRKRKRELDPEGYGAHIREQKCHFLSKVARQETLHIYAFYK